REVFQADEAAAARRLLEGLEGEEKGFRDFMETIAPLGSCLDFQMLLHATELDSAALYYLIDFGVKAGYLRRQANGDLRPAADLLRLTLEKRLDRQRRARVLRRGIPQMPRRLAAGGAPLELYLETAALEREEGRHDRAFRWYVEGALAARALHDRETYLRAVDAARECYREAGARKKPLQHAAEDLLGPAGRGLTGLDRLRRLPLEVRVKITDFGIARRAVGDEEEEDDERSDPLPWGTPRYMSPEQARQKPLSAASDLFSFGILAQELLLGRHPLGGLKGRAAIAAIHAGAIKPPPAGKAGIPEELRVLLGRLLDMSPQKRPAAREIARRLQALQVSMALGEYGG
ncbi:MAG: protein kinase, partial [Planctomycetota bacterium]